MYADHLAFRQPRMVAPVEPLEWSPTLSVEYFAAIVRLGMHQPNSPRRETRSCLSVARAHRRPKSRLVQLCAFAGEFSQSTTGPIQCVGENHHFSVTDHADCDLVNVVRLSVAGVDIDPAVAFRVRQRDFGPSSVPCVASHGPCGGYCGLQVARVLEEVLHPGEVSYNDRSGTIGSAGGIRPALRSTNTTMWLIKHR